MSSSLLKIILPLVAILVVWLLCKYKYNYSFKDDLQLRASRFSSLVAWIMIAMAWMLVTDYFVAWRGPWDFAPWKAQTLAVSVSRVLAVCFLGPIAEELVFRGVLHRRLIKSGKIASWMVVAILAAAWALMHYTYTPTVIFIIFIQGLVLGIALLRTRSLFVPIAMHIAWNLYAVW